MSNCHECEGEATNSIPHYLIDIIYKTAIRFRKITNDAKDIQTNSPSDLYIFWMNYSNANRSFLHPFCLGRNIFKKLYLGFWVGTGAWVKLHWLNAFFRNVNNINWKLFPTHSGIYKLEKIQQEFWREVKKLKFKESLKKGV